MDPRPEPQLKVNELGKKLHALAEIHCPSEFELASTRREVEMLLQKGILPARCHGLLGVICALSLDRQGFLDHFRIAKQLSPERHIRALSALYAQRLGLFQYASDQVSELFTSYPDDVQMLGLARDIGGGSLNFELFFDSRAAMLRLGIEEPEKVTRAARKFESTLSLCKSIGVTWEALITRLDAAATVVIEHREAIFESMYDYTPEGRVGLDFGVKCDIDKITEINFAIVDRIVEQFDDTLAEVVTFACLPARRELLASRLSDASEAAQH